MIPLETCEFPGCANEFPDHYISNICGARHVFLGGTCGTDVGDLD